MRQVFQSLEDGATTVEEVPAPQLASGHVLIRTRASVVSAGTERMLVDFGRANLFEKARQQPDRVRQVRDKVGTDGIMPTLRTIRSQLARPVPLGYANAGVVLAVGEGISDLRPGDAVVSNGPHAEVVSVARNLCVPRRTRMGDDAIAFEWAAFAPVGAVALQGVRLAQPTIGERFVVTGLGLVGLLTVQLLRANGCEVLGVDLMPDRLELASQFGAEIVDLSAGADPVAVASAFAHGRGVDGVIVTASTSSSEPVHQAATMCRQRGRIVLVGVTGLELQRADFYEKELSFQVSCSYGPGRYDPLYERKGHDYPFGFVRWTAARNFEAFLDLVANGAVDVGALITRQFPIEHAVAAYRVLSEDRSSIGIVLTYPTEERTTDAKLLQRHVLLRPRAPSKARCRVAVIGAGNYAQQVLLPALAATPAILDTVISDRGATAKRAAERFHFSRASTDVAAALSDDAIDTVIIATRHDTHAELTSQALRADKHVFVEKPLALERSQLDGLARAYGQLVERGDAPLLMVGYNRRFSHLTARMRALLALAGGPVTLIATVNAGPIPADHWTQDPEVGGGRIVGEACHFVDLLRNLAGERITTAKGSFLDVPLRDTVMLHLTFAHGSIGTVHYIATGSKRFPKERIEAFARGGVLQLDNYRSLRGFGWPGFTRERAKRQDKGHRAQLAAFVDAIKSGRKAPIPFDELLEVSYATLDAAGL